MKSLPISLAVILHPIIELFNLMEGIIIPAFSGKLANFSRVSINSYITLFYYSSQNYHYEYSYL